MSAKTTWPALMLAHRRIARVRGRISVLNDSIRVRGGESQGGHPLGVRLAREVL